MRRVVWTTVAILGAVLVETALGYLVSEPGRYLDPFLLVVVYCALRGGEGQGLLAGVAAGWVQDVLFGGPILGLSALAKLLVGFFVGAAGSHFLIGSASARVLVLLLATVAEGLLVQWLSSVFAIQASPMSPLTLASRATLTAVAGGVLYTLIDRRLQGSEAWKGIR